MSKWSIFFFLLLIGGLRNLNSEKLPEKRYFISTEFLINISMYFFRMVFMALGPYLNSGGTWWAWHQELPKSHHDVSYVCMHVLCVRACVNLWLSMIAALAQLIHYVKHRRACHHSSLPLETSCLPSWNSPCLFFFVPICICKRGWRNGEHLQGS